MWEYVSYAADALSVVSAIVTVISALSIRSYYKKIIRQFAVEKLTNSEQKMQTAIEAYQQIKRMYSGNQRGVNIQKLSKLYLDIDEIFDSISFAIPTIFTSIISSIKTAKGHINQAIMANVILSKNDHYSELGLLLDDIYSGIKLEKEKIQKQNMK